MSMLLGVILFLFGAVARQATDKVVDAAWRRLSLWLRGRREASLEQRHHHEIVVRSIRKMRNNQDLAYRCVAATELGQHYKQWLVDDAFDALCEAVGDRSLDWAVRLHAVNVLESVKPLRRQLLLGGNVAQ